MSKKVHKKAPTTYEGKGTYYPGRTKPLRGLLKTLLVGQLERDHFTFASPCGKKGEVYRIERKGDGMNGRPALVHYALLNDRIMHHQCREVGKTRGSDDEQLMPNGASVPLIDLSRGLAVFFGIRGRAGIGRFQIAPVPPSEHAAVLAQMGPRVAMKTRR